MIKQLDNILEYLELKTRWKPFLICLLAGFLMTALPRLGLKIHFNQSSLKNPQIMKKPDIFESITPKLEIIKNTYKLKSDPIKKDLAAVVPVAISAAPYDLAHSYVVTDYDTGEILAEKDSNTKTPIASLTKIMTAIITLDLISKDTLFKIPEAATRIQPTKMGVVPGQSWSVEELLNGMLLTSANDVAKTFEEDFNQIYGDDVFVRAMNEKAKFLGLKNTHFENPQGFDSPNQYSTTHDLAILSHYALENYPLIKEIVKKDYQFYPETENHKQVDLYNWNGLINVYPGIEGIKIGNTGDAKYTTIVLSERENRAPDGSPASKKILVVLLGAPGVLERDLWSSQLLDQGFQKSTHLEPINVTESQLKSKYATWKYFK